jgi:hypothetical protein
MKKLVAFVLGVALIGGSLVASQGKNAVAGKWNLTIEGASPFGHHFPAVELELEQDGKKITANFLIPDHGDLPMEGEFVDGKLTLRTTEDGYMQMNLSGKLGEDGTMSGTVKAQPIGEMTWTAKRAVN